MTNTGPAIQTTELPAHGGVPQTGCEACEIFWEVVADDWQRTADDIEKQIERLRRMSDACQASRNRPSV